MNVLFISNDPSIFDPSSPARARMREYANAIGTLHILSAAPTKTERVTRDDLPEGRVLMLYALPAHPFFRFKKMTQEAKRIIKEEQIQLVSAQDPFEYGIVALQATQGTNVKLHVQLHTDVFSPWFTKSTSSKISNIRMPALNKVRRKLADRVLPKAQGIRVVSKRIQDSIIARYGNRVVKPTVIPISVSDTIPPAVPLPQHSFAFSLMTVGRLEPEKRIEDIIVAIAEIHMRYPSIGLFIAGDGSERKKLNELAVNLGLNENVIFLGNRPDAIGLMQSTNGYIQASAYEGYGRTLIEAALAHVPIISTNVGIVGDVLRPGEEVLAVEPGDPAMLAEQIKKLLEDNRLRYEMSTRAEQRVKEHLASAQNTPSAIATELAQIFQTP